MKNPLLLLTLLRLREFIREPGALFWTFGFPMLLTIALGIAFREDRAPKQTVAVVKGSAAEALLPWLEEEGHVAPLVATEDEARLLLRRGRVVLIAGGKDEIVYT